MTKSTKEAIRILEDATGLSEMEMLEEGTFDSLAWAVCMNDGCDYTTQYEPDCCEGWCEECEEGSVMSILVLRNMI